MRSRQIALIHYSAPPVIGGVETVLQRQAEVLARHGHVVRILSGTRSAQAPEGVKSVYVPELASGYPVAGLSPELLEGPARQTRQALARALRGTEIAIVHNMLTMLFNFPATLALFEMAAKSEKIRWINWIHDISSPRPGEKVEDELSRWSLRVTGGERDPFQHVAVSDLRRREFIKARGSAKCGVIPNGVDPARLLALPPAVERFAEHHALFERDFVLLHPTRLVRRKNIECGIALMSELRKRKVDAALIVTGAPDPHSPASELYARELHARAKRARPRGNVIFAGADFSIGESDLAALYRLADALFFPSLKEGFGLPLLEAAVHRIPAFASGIEPFREHSSKTVTFFKPVAPVEEIADLILRHMAKDRRAIARKEIVRQYSWEAIYREHLAPLLNA